MQTVILGLGNELLGDEGVGIHALRLLQNDAFPHNIEIVEVGTAIIDTLPILESAEKIIIIDAMKGDSPPGTVYKSSLEECSKAGCIASMHGFDIHRTMALTKRTDKPEVVVFGVEPHSLDWSLELSETVSHSLPHLLKAIKDEVS